MPHLRIEVAEEWLREDFIAATGFDAKKLLDHLVQVVAGLKMEHPDNLGEQVPFINLSNLKHAIIPVHHAHVAGDPQNASCTSRCLRAMRRVAGPLKYAGVSR